MQALILNRFRRCLLLLMVSFSPFLSTGLAQGQNAPVKRTRPRAALLVRADSDCALTIDGNDAGMLQTSKWRAIQLPLGEHVVTATLADGSFRWDGVVNMDKPIQKVLLVNIAQQKAVALQRQQQELQAAMQAAQARAQAEQAQAQQQQLMQRQLQVQQQRQAISQQIQELEKQLQAELDAAHNDEKEANDQRASAAGYGMSNNAWGKLAGQIGQMGANESAKAAAQHRARVEQLQQQINSLTRQMALVGN